MEPVKDQVRGQIGISFDFNYQVNTLVRDEVILQATLRIYDKVWGQTGDIRHQIIRQVKEQFKGGL